LDGTLTVLDVLLDVQDGREEEVGVLGKGRVFVLGSEELKELLRKGYVLLVEHLDVPLRLVQELEGCFEELDVVVELSR